VRWTSGLIEDAAFLPLPNRLAQRLLVLADLYGRDAADGGVRISLQLSQTELGQMMGTTRESVNRHLQAWRRRGWIGLDRGSVVIRDRDALQDRVDAGLDDHW
jgi:CRP/FNR family transcriptional regulator, cyclic AMP receptor protein